jgi:hypothetical protein
MPNLVVSDSASLDVEVVSSANPDPNLLRSIRLVLPQNDQVRQVFLDAQSERDFGEPVRVDRQRLLGLLHEVYPHDEIQDVVEYLSDEFEQIGDGILLVSSDTGKAIAKISEDSLYEAAPVLRETGNTVERGVMVRPDIEAFLSYWSFENDRERIVRSQALARLNQTELQREDGDRRTRILSRDGRRGIAQDVQDLVGEAFKKSDSGSRYFALLDYFPVGGSLPEPTTPFKIILWSRVRRKIQDQLTVNPKYDPLTATLAAVTSSWKRSIVSTLLKEATSRELEWPVAGLDEALEDHGSGGMWFCEPNLARALLDRGCRVFAAPGPPNLALHMYRQAGYLELDEEKIGTNNREVHDRWTIESAAEVTLHVCWDFVDIVPITGDFSSGVSVEVV